MSLTMLRDTGGDSFTGASIEYVSMGDTRIAYRRAGHGSPLVLIHGWPFDSSTFAALVDALAPHRTCYLPDSPGLGVTEWTARTDFSVAGQVAAFRRFLDALAIDRCAILAHDTGATIARVLAAAEPARVDKLVLLNTEMPGHRPPWIPLYRHLAALPGAGAGFSLLMGSQAFIRSRAGFGGCFHDPARLDAAFVARTVRPLRDSARRLAGALRYLRGIEWPIVDALAETHRRIEAEVLMIWGAADRTFPLSLARRLPGQFRRCAGLVEVPDACFLVHEERPADVSEHTLRFLIA